MTIIPVYAALLALMLVGLSLRTIRLRQRYQVALGDGGHADLLRAIRVQANFVEYVPLCLLLLAVLELTGAPVWLLHVLGAALLVGRSLHAYGVSRVRETLLFRMVGMLSTFSVLIVASLVVLIAALRG